jgi:hypothetical protein
MPLVAELEISVGGKVFDNLEAGVDHLVTELERDTDNAVLAVGVEMQRALQLVAKSIAEKHANPWNGSVVNTSRYLQARSGGGIRSILQSVRMTDNTPKLVGAQISTGALTVHETGATVTAKRAKYLTIPLPAALDSVGLPLRARARDWDNTFVARSKKGTLLIFRKDGKEITPLYLLKRSVYIPPRLAMGQEVDDGLPYFERKAFETLAAYLES